MSVLPFVRKYMLLVSRSSLEVLVPQDKFLSYFLVQYGRKILLKGSNFMRAPQEDVDKYVHERAARLKLPLWNCEGVRLKYRSVRCEKIKTKESLQT
eukprot:5661093-Amphidinium_carterae.1